MKLASLMLLSFMVLNGCNDAQSEDVENDMTSCQGELLELDGNTYCALIEEGALDSDCPDDFPFGVQIAGVIVCAEDDDIPQMAVNEELDRRGLSRTDAPQPQCFTDADCPEFFSVGCSGNSVVTNSESAGICMEDGTCSPGTGPGPQIDPCSENEVCQDGACIPTP